MNEVLKDTADKLKSDRLELQAKIKEMKAAEDAIRKLLGDENPKSDKKDSSSRVTVADKIKAVLAEHPSGLDINTLTDAISINYKEEASKSTIQSQLSRLSGSLVENVNGMWVLKLARPRIKAGERIAEFQKRHEESVKSRRPYGLPDDIPF